MHCNNLVSVLSTCAILITGCGGNMGDPPEPDLGFADVWDGVASISPPFDPSPFVYDKTLIASVSGYAVTVGGLCQVRGPAFVAIGTERTATWDGAIVCVPAPVPGCDEASLTVRHMELTLRPGELEIIGNGVTNGCGEVKDVVITFFGTPVIPLP